MRQGLQRCTGGVFRGCWIIISIVIISCEIITTDHILHFKVWAVYCMPLIPPLSPFLRSQVFKVYLIPQKYEYTQCGIK